MWEAPPWTPLDSGPGSRGEGWVRRGCTHAQGVTQNLDNLAGVCLDIILRDGAGEVKEVWVTSIRDLPKLPAGSWFWLRVTRMCSPSCLTLWFRAVVLPLGGCRDFDMDKFSRNSFLKFSLFICVWKNKSLLLVLNSNWILKQAGLLFCFIFLISSNNCCSANAY